MNNKLTALEIYDKIFSDVQSYCIGKKDRDFYTNRGLKLIQEFAENYYLERRKVEEDFNKYQKENQL